jgi:hypothetical protein
MSRTPALARAAMITLMFGGWTLASCDLAGSDGGPGDGPGIPGSPSVLSASTLPLATQRVSSLPPTEANFDSYTSVISRDGLVVAFQSDATNLVGGDTNGTSDIYVTDLASGATVRASVDSSNVIGNGYSYGPNISADGRHVAFSSSSNNLVAGDTNFTDDVFVRDLSDGTTARVSVDSAGTQGTGYSYCIGLSDDGRFVVFYTSSNLVPEDANGTYDIYVHDRDTDTNDVYDESGQIATTRISVHSNGTEANSSSFGQPGACISSDGRFVAFYSYASNLVDDDTNNASDAFIHDRNDGSTTRVSLAADGSQTNDYTYSCSVSGDATQVMFYSYASNLVPGDTNFSSDLFARSRTDVTSIRRVSVSTSGAQAIYGGFGWSLSTTGRYVAFYSYSPDLAPGDGGFTYDVFLRDRDLDNDSIFDEDGQATTTRISVDSFLNAGNSDSYEPIISGDGDRVVYYSYASNLVLGDSNGRFDVFLREVSAGTTRRVSQGVQPGGNSTSSDPSMDASGLIIAFTSNATNLVPVDLNGFADIFVRDVRGGPCIKASVSSAGAEGNSTSQRPSQSANGRFVAFESAATNFAADFNGTFDIFVRDLAFGITSRVSVATGGAEANSSSFRASISADGRYVSFDSTASNLVANDLNGVSDVFMHDRLTGITKRVSVDSAGLEGNGSSLLSVISADGSFVAYASSASNLVAGDTNGFQDVFVHEVATGVTTRVSIATDGTQGNSLSGNGTTAISADGRIVVFDSTASTLIPADANGTVFDVFVHDRTTGVTSLVSKDSTGVQGNSNSLRPSMSEDGRYIVYDSAASNLVAGDSNGLFDIFRHDLLTGATIRVNVSSAGGQSTGGSCNIGVISSDGRMVAFQCTANNLVPEDTEGFIDIYLRGPLP